MASSSYGCPFKLWIASWTDIYPCVVVVVAVTPSKLTFYCCMFTKIYERLMMQLVLLSVI